MSESRITISAAADFRDLYANHIQTRLTIWDLQLIFGRLKHASTPGTAEISAIEQMAAVTMSAPTAKALLQSLQSHIEAYEALFGEIRLDQINVHPDVAKVSLQ